MSNASEVARLINAVQKDLGEAVQARLEGDAAEMVNRVSQATDTCRDIVLLLAEDPAMPDRTLIEVGKLRDRLDSLYDLAGMMSSAGEVVDRCAVGVEGSYNTSVNLVKQFR